MGASASIESVAFDVEKFNKSKVIMDMECGDAEKVAKIKEIWTATETAKLPTPRKEEPTTAKLQTPRKEEPTTDKVPTPRKDESSLASEKVSSPRPMVEDKVATPRKDVAVPTTEPCGEPTTDAAALVAQEGSA